MNYIKNIPNNSSNYGNPMSNPFDDCVSLPDELLQSYIDANGFVNITVEDGVVTSVEKNVEAWEAWHETLPPEQEPEPTDTEVLNVLLGVTENE